MKKAPLAGAFFIASASLFSPANFSNNEYDQSDKSNHQENAPNHARLKNTFYDRTAAKTNHQCQSQEKNI
jgi:hypothetical protein